MKDFNKRGGFNDRGGRGGFGGDRGNRGGFGGDRPRFGGKPDFKNKGFKKFNDRGRDDDREMFSATCSECGRNCQVPFRPSGDKPVFCDDCFNAQKEAKSGNFAPKPRFDKGFDKRDRFDRPQRDFAPTARPVAVMDERNERRIDELKAQVAGLKDQMKEVLAILAAKPVVSAPVAESKKESAPKSESKPAVKKAVKAEAKPSTKAKKAAAPAAKKAAPKKVATKAPAKKAVKKK